MAEVKYKDYLAACIITGNQPVTYKLLSRALQVNVSVAKWMLFDFHQKQNAKKANSIHATYLISGTKRSLDDISGTNSRGDEVVSMRSSPFMSSMPEQEGAAPEEEPVKKSALLMVREEELAKTRAEFSEEASIHIYSLEPGPLENLNVLAACNREANAESADNDPLERWRLYGSIQNHHIKRRTAKYAPPLTAAVPTKLAAKSTNKPSAKPLVAIQLKKEVSASSRRGSASEDNASGRSTPQPAAAPSTLKRSDSTKSTGIKNKTAGDIFKSFAKAKAKPKDTVKSNGSTSASAQDQPMQGMSEDEGDDDEPEVQVDTEKVEAAKKARDERAEKLRKMMEVDDEDMPDAPVTREIPTEASQSEKAETPKEEEPEPSVTIQNGRRRGKRRVMKKKTVKDEEGYLAVTKEEAAWESFSEDEPEPKRAKPAPKPAAAKGKPATKKGQGSIASFFKKA
ncbi:uncharacterized protein M421DRAFT_64338 [Didymella exigua CBS 183.55]|uniref:DNA polymerase delta subunit 3 n=1 Tax=Didymella exigua CBS 183.55 TaxID=1150837 RepID=A0A6A5RL86_9PLEO|nr:uncharacterized protein M421DRAFT_64338 [Didymella exigua CBS 183.55]KAF1928010.1 hypothetical protein M421DRAFT_64338 [Didymella exigua CBS 183.55]